MIIIEQIKGLTAKPNAPEFKPSSDQAIAHIPDYNFMINANYFENNKALDMVNGLVVENESSATSIMQVGGNKVFNTPMADGKFFRLRPQTKLNGEEITVLFVAKPDESTAATGLGTIITGNDNIDDKSIKVSFNASRSQLQFFGAGGLVNALNPKVSYVLTAQNRSNLTLYMVSFSTEKGYEIRVNGKQESTNTADKEVRTSQLNPNDWSVLRNFSGQCGFVTVLDNDLTLPRNSRFLSEIESHFMKKYGITV